MLPFRPRRQAGGASAKEALTAGVVGVFVAMAGWGQFLPPSPPPAPKWHLERIGMPEVWQVTTGSPDIIFAIPDTGIDLDSPEFEGRLYGSYDFVENDEYPDDESYNSHGTAIAGVVGGNPNNGVGGEGLDWQCRIMAMRVRPDGDQADVAAFDRAIERGARVISYSTGGGPDNTISAAADRAAAAGIFLVAATGNSNLDRIPVTLAGHPEVLAVGASDHEDQRAAFSNYGEGIDLIAPGENLVTVDNQQRTTTAGGTSVAAPLVGAAATLLLSIDASLDRHDLARLIKAGAKDIAPAGYDIWHGWGRLDVARSMRLLLNPPPAPLVEMTAEGCRLTSPAAPAALALGLHRIEYSDDLTTWIPVPPESVSYEAPVAFWLDPAPSPRRFYRLARHLARTYVAPHSD